MKAQIAVDMDDIIDGLSYKDTVELAKKLSREYLDIEEQMEAILAAYSYEEILDCIDPEIIENYIH